MNQRDTYHHGDLRAVLVAEGLRHLEASGEGTLSLRALAKAAGVSPNAPYRHFADKPALMGALAAEGFRIFAEAIVTAPGDSPPLEGLRAQGRAYLAFAEDHPALYRLMFSPYGYSLHSTACQQASERAFGALVGATARAQAAGWKSDRDLGATALVFWSALHGWALILADHLLPPEAPKPGTEVWLETFFYEGNRPF